MILPAGGAVVIATNQPIFCNSCHEMTLHYATWRQSAHSEVACEECHLMPGTVNMFKSKLVALRQVRLHAAGDVRTAIIKGHVPDENCRRCHPETRELVTYHGLKITHKAHWGMGRKCTFCHDRVAHGPRWQFEGVTSAKRFSEAATPSKYAPAMETCLTCHDGKRASHKCSTCHVTLGERRAVTFDPAWVAAHQEEVHSHGEGDCRRCHQDTFCDRCHREANPHPHDWIPRHVDESAKSPQGCATCHLMPAEIRPSKISQMAFCRACHSLRREHKGLDWQLQHGKESLQDPAACQRCHVTSWCSDCHAISRPHPQEWLARHPAEASRDPENCKVCHTRQFCDACHQGKKGIPSSHTREWLTEHKKVARVSKTGCAVCHKTEFCQRCHAKKAPISHGAHWMGQHGVASKAQPASCLLCHKEQHCEQCHGLTMPHPKLWLAAHHKTAAKDPELCDQCHREQACDTCHRGAFPASHRPSDWMSSHGKQAQKAGEDCSLCHRPGFCSSCHGLTMPHPSGWIADTHGDAAGKDRSVCFRCHQESHCSKCHGITMPHPDSWMGEHGKTAATAPGTCVKCHGPDHNDCAACHAALAPANHQQPDWMKQHAHTGMTADDSCTLCHGKNSCITCHAKAAKSNTSKGK